MITQRTRLDMRPGGVLPVVHVSQYDNDAAALIFDLYDGGELFTVPTGSSVLLNGLKPDNYGFSYQAASISGNTVVCNLTTQMTAVAGAVVCELRVRNGAGTQIIGSCNFILQVEAAALTDDTIISDTMIPLIEQAVEIASNLDRYITQTQSNAQIATEAATTATNAANSAQIVDANVTGLYNSIEEAKTNANTAAANANTVAANIAAAAARGDYKGDKGDKGDSGVTTPVWGMYTMYVDESTGDLWLVTNGEYGSEYWFRYDSETGLLYYCTPDYVEKTVSGELIEITDGANLGALQCKVAFSPIQSGTGDPSPTNIRPISGRTGMTVTHANKNLMPNMAGQSSSTSNGITYTYNDDGTITIDGTATTSSQMKSVTGLNRGIYLPKGTYKKTSVRLATDKYYGVLVQYAVDSWTTVEGGGLASDTFVIDRDEPLAIRVGVTSGTVVDNQLVQPVICAASVNDLTWESPVKTEIPITWESIAGTVYGGTLDVVSGVLTVDKGFITLDGTQTIANRNWRPTAGSVGWLYPYAMTQNVVPASSAEVPAITSNRMKEASYSAMFNGTENNCIGLVYDTSKTYGLAVRYADTSLTTDAAINAFLAENPIQVVFPLETPQTYQLTPTKVRTLLGVNNVWSDGDTIEAFTYVSESYDEEG